MTALPARADPDRAMLVTHEHSTGASAFAPGSAATAGASRGSQHATDVARRVNAERVVLFGWSRAILLQLAHPLVAAGVYEHSGFRRSPASAIARLHHTVGAMLALTFGDPAERQHALDGIRGIHRRVHGRLALDAGPFAAGTSYSAEDPELVLWVHLTLLESVPLIYETLVLPLTDDDRDAYCAASAPLAVELGARDSDVPRTWKTLRHRLDSTSASGALVVTPQARELAGALLAPRFASVVAPAAWANRRMTVGLLPQSIREQYGFRWTARDERSFRRVTSLLRWGQHWAPKRLTIWKPARSS